MCQQCHHGHRPIVRIINIWVGVVEIKKQWIRDNSYISVTEKVSYEDQMSTRIAAGVATANSSLL